MELAKMLNVTILACLLILTGCFGLGAVDDDVIDDAEGQDTGSGSTTIVNAYPQVQSFQMNETISLSQGESLELLTVYHGSVYGNWTQSASILLEYNCSTMSGRSGTYFTYASQHFAPSDGGACTYTLSGNWDNYPEYIVMYRVWS